MNVRTVTHLSALQTRSRCLGSLLVPAAARTGSGASGLIVVHAASRHLLDALGFRERPHHGAHQQRERHGERDARAECETRGHHPDDDRRSSTGSRTTRTLFRSRATPIAALTPSLSTNPGGHPAQIDGRQAPPSTPVDRAHHIGRGTTILPAATIDPRVFPLRAPRGRAAHAPAFCLFDKHSSGVHSFLSPFNVARRGGGCSSYTSSAKKIARCCFLTTLLGTIIPNFFSPPLRLPFSNHFQKGAVMALFF